jgi:hypothetical protein
MIFNKFRILIISLASFFFLNIASSIIFALPAIATAGKNIFSQKPVGAEGIGMGGAWEGLADNGAAIFWNPAQLTEMLTSLSGLNSSYTNSLLLTQEKYKKNKFDLIEEKDPSSIQTYFSFGNFSSSAIQKEKRQISFALTGNLPFGVLSIGYREEKNQQKQFNFWQDSENGLKDNFTRIYYLGYAFAIRALSFGLAVKAADIFYNPEYTQGLAMDLGVSLEPLPFVRFSLVLNQMASKEISPNWPKQELISKNNVTLTIPGLDTLVSMTLAYNYLQKEYVINSGLKILLPKNFELLAGYMDQNPTGGIGFDGAFINIYYAALWEKKAKYLSHHIAANFIF